VQALMSSWENANGFLARAQCDMQPSSIMLGNVGTDVTVNEQELSNCDMHAAERDDESCDASLYIVTLDNSGQSGIPVFAPSKQETPLKVSNNGWR